jgi:hypothetical protein
MGNQITLMIPVHNPFGKEIIVLDNTNTSQRCVCIAEYIFFVLCI